MDKNIFTYESFTNKKLDVIAVIIDVSILLENSPVFQSQVVDQLIALQSFGLSTGLIATTSNRQLFDSLIGHKLCSANVSLCLVQDRGFFKNLISFRKSLKILCKKNKIRFAYVRGIWGAIVVQSIYKPWRLPYIYDVRGSVIDETYARGGSKLKIAVYAAIEKFVIKNAIKVSAVSTYLAKMVESNYKINFVYVIPCCVNVSSLTVSKSLSNKKRLELNYKETDIIFVYSGGLSKYQQIPEMLELWRKYLKYPQIHFILLLNAIPEDNYLFQLCESFGDRLKYFKLSKVEVPVFLSVADIGFMLRESRELNKSASPVKFPEYLSAGLLVVTSPDVGDISEHVISNDLGVLVDPKKIEIDKDKVLKLIKRIKPKDNHYKEKAIKFVSEKYDWAGYIEIYTQIYDLID